MTTPDWLPCALDAGALEAGAPAAVVVVTVKPPSELLWALEAEAGTAPEAPLCPFEAGAGAAPEELPCALEPGAATMVVTVTVGAVVTGLEGPAPAAELEAGKAVRDGNVLGPLPLPACGGVEGVDVVCGKEGVVVAPKLALLAEAAAAALEPDKNLQYDDEDTTQVQALDI